MRKTIDFFNKCQSTIGIAVSWLSLVMVLVMASVVILRYVFNIGWIALQESVMYLHASLFMLGAAYTLQQDNHVRVDVFYREWSAKKQAWVNLCGGLFFLLPMCASIFYLSFNYVLDAWRIYETSREAGGLPYVYVLKSLLLVMPTLLAIQACLEIMKAIMTIREEL